jgi:hypothetical protein
MGENHPLTRKALPYAINRNHHFRARANHLKKGPFLAFPLNGTAFVKPRINSSSSLQVKEKTVL